ncbi:MAG TPA: DUF6089 family protein [Chitinophagales bacterium]|nr:DUF6089 family protein [Chitinophagales bacterium]
MNSLKKIYLLTLLLVLAYAQDVKSQQFLPSHSLGFSTGVSSFLGDLGGSRNIGRGFIYDLNIQVTRPALGVFYKYNANPFISIKAELAYTQITGNDKFSKAEWFVDEGYYRRYRNLNFTSPVISFGAMVELNLYKYEPGNTDNFKVAPFVGIGGGGFWFDPRTTDPLTGEKVRLQPLGTEGQGLPGYEEKYSLIQPQLLGSAGLKFNAGPALSMTFEVVYHQTFTDYLDDVSGDFIDPMVLYNYYDNATASQIYRLHNRSPELGFTDPRFDPITRPGEIRGNTKDNDQFFRVQASFMFVLGAKQGGKKSNLYRCPVW